MGCVPGGMRPASRHHRSRASRYHLTVTNPGDLRRFTRRQAYAITHPAHNGAGLTGDRRLRAQRQHPAGMQISTILAVDR
jgi:hypothetical protein